MLVKVRSHWDEAVGLLLEQHRHSSNFLAILKAVAEQGNHVEDLLWAVLTHLDFHGRTSAIPTGPRLDRVGSIAKVSRFEGESDNDYLLRMRQEVGLDVASTPDEILRLVRAFTGDRVPYYIPEHPAKYVLYCHLPKRDLTQAFLDRVSAAGVRGMIGLPLWTTHNVGLRDAQGRQILVLGPKPLPTIMIGHDKVVMAESVNQKMVGI